MYIRYNTTTLVECYRSVAPFTSAPPVGYADVQVPDSSINGPVGQCRINAGLTAVASDPTLTPAPTPNWSGFTAAMKAVWANSYDALRSMAQKYPLFAQYLTDRNADGVKADILAAYNAGDITKPPTSGDQYSAIKVAIAANNIPITGLP